MNKSKKLFIFLFFFIIFCPILFAGIYFATGTKLDTSLKGYFDSHESPELTMNSYISGEYQTQYEQWLNSSLIPRGLYTKIYNQIEYSCFNLGSRIIGKNNNIFEDDYVFDALALNEFNYAHPDNRAELNEYAEHLASIRSKLQEHNKHLIVYFTPSKAVHDSEDIPIRYRIRQESEILRAADYLKEFLNETGIPYLDSETLIPTQKYPIFYPTGIHWARPLEQETSQALVDMLKSVSQKDLRNIVLTSANESQEPYWRDADVYDLLNVFSPYPDITYYEYSTERQYPDSYDKARILLQGGSFAQGFLRDYFELYCNEDISYINYDNYLLDDYGKMQTLETWDDLNLGACLDKADFIVIELQEAAIRKYSSGFVAYLDQYLDSYVPARTDRTEYSACFDATEQNGLEYSKGYSGFEDGYAWVEQNSSVMLRNKHIGTDGITIELTVPEYTLLEGDTTLHIYANQVKIDTVSVSSPGMLKLDYDSDVFSKDTDIYEIEICCENGFIPEELGLNDDPRELSLMIHYIGEKR